MALSPSQKEEQRRLYTQLVALPAEQSRGIAQRQRDAYSAKVDKLLGGPFTKFYKEELLATDTFLRWGDDLQSSSDEKDRQERRKLYARAFLRARNAAEMLDQELASDGPSVLAIKDIFAIAGEGAEVAGEGIKEAGKKVAEVAGEVVKPIAAAAQSASNSLLLLGGLGLGIYLVATGRRR